MTRLNGDNIKLSKVNSTPKKGYKLGSTSASWRKIKSVTSNSKFKGNNSQINPEGIINEEPEKLFIDYGERGELFITYSNYNTVEIWDWVSKFPDEKMESDTLYLHGKYTICSNINEVESKERIIYDMKYLKENYNGEISLLYLLKYNETWKLEVHNLAPENNESYIQQSISIPRYMSEINTKKCNNFKIKVNQKFIIYSNQEGYCYILKYNVDSKKYLPGNFNLSLNSFKTSSKQQLPKEINDLVNEEEVIFRTSIYETVPIFDLVNNWLVLSPVKDEYKSLSISNECGITNVDDFDPFLSLQGQKNTILDAQVFTPVKLPPPGPLLNRLISSISSNALDGICKISEASSNLVRDYLNKEKKFRKSTLDDRELNQILNSIGKTLGKILYSTASTTVSTIQRSANNLKHGDNQLIKVFDLSSDSILATFRAPGGVSNVSLSPYDLQLVHSSIRGDSFYMWDLYKLPNEASLVGKFTRGKTSAVIHDIVWFINNHDQDVIGNNLGFGCISNTGTIHWFNVNYLFGGLSNHPNNLGKENLEDSMKEGDFLNSWILSSLNAKKFIKLPNISNLKNDKNKHIYFNQLAIIDGKNEIKLLSSLNGNHQYKYVIPNAPVDTNIEYLRIPRNSVEQDIKIHPLSQTEIETCPPYLNLVNNNNITFSTYNFSDEGSAFDNLKAHYSYFGGNIPTNFIKFPHSNYYGEFNYYGDSLTNNFQSIVLDEAAY